VPTDSSYQAIDTTLNDTVYGISNEALIPVRKAKVAEVIEQQPIEKLFDPNIKTVEVTNWEIIILLGSVVLIGIVKAFSNNRFKQGIKALFNYGVAQEITREEKVFFHRSNILFTFIHLLTTALFIYQLKEFVGVKVFSSNGFGGFLLILAFLAGMYIVKYLFSKLLLFVFNDTTIAPEYIFNVSLYNNLLGTFFIIILCITYFSLLPISFILIYIALPLILITFFLRVVRLFIVGKTKGILYFYIFVYLCSLEILPLVVLYRIFIHK
jgi:hypothetical protein